MLELKVSASTVGAIGKAFNQIQEMARSGQIETDTPVRIQLAKGNYPGVLSYNLANPLIIEGAAGTMPEEITVSAENCEAFHKDTENRAVFVIGPGATEVTLRGFTIENTHIKTADDASLGNQAEALCFHNQTGNLLCQDMRFISRQDTVHVKGFSRFENCYITGDVDFIWGYCDTSVWQDCLIHTRQDNRPGIRPAYVVQSRALNSRPGFVFIDCTFTADKRPEGSRIWIGRSQGTGRADSVDRWDSIALIGCRIDENYDSEIWTDEDGKKAVYPEKGTKDSGWREYGTRRIGADGNEIPDRTELRNCHGAFLAAAEAQSLRDEYAL